MLVLSRREGESIKIGDDITLVFYDVQGDRVRVGIDAPKEIAIVRTELLQIAEQNKEAVSRPAKNLRSVIGGLKIDKG